MVRENKTALQKATDLLARQDQSEKVLRQKLLLKKYYGAEVDDSTVELANWALMASDQADCYREAQVQVINGGQIIRQYTYPNAFVMGYTEDLDDDAGVGTFVLTLKQKKDLTAKVELKGNFEE